MGRTPVRSNRQSVGARPNLFQSAGRVQLRLAFTQIPFGGALHHAQVTLVSYPSSETWDCEERKLPRERG